MITPSVRVQELDGTWRQLGTGRLRGIVPEGLTYSSNVWGPDTCSFTVKTPTAAVERPDLLPFTPVEVEIDGAVVWSGRMIQRPTDETQHQVACQGWQYHLDDDVYEQAYVVTRLSEWRDWRQNLACDLTVYKSSWNQAVGESVTFDYVGPTDGSFPRTGIYLDLGPSTTAARVVATWVKNQWAATATCYLNAMSTLPGSMNTGSVEATISTLSDANTSGTFTRTLTTPSRYLGIFCDTGTDQAEDRYFQIETIQVFAATAYESGNASILKADVVVKDARNRAAPLLNQTDVLVNAGTFSIPEYTTGGYVTPRQAIEQANVYENYLAQVGGHDLKTLRYRAKPSSPVIEVGSWSGALVSDASVDGQEIFNGAITDATGPDGNRLVAARATGNLSGSTFGITATVQPANPGFETATTSWQVGSTASVARDTGVFDTGVASGRVNTSATDPLIYVDAWTAAFIPGLRYRITARLRKTASLSEIYWMVYKATAAATPKTGFLEQSSNFVGSLTTGAFVTATYDFTATQTDHDIGWLMVPTAPASDVCYIDTVSVQVVGRSLPDRRQFLRRRVIPVRSGVTQAVAERFADLWLTEHITSPFAASVTVKGQQACRAIPSGAPIPAHLIPLYVGEKLRVSHRVDPDTGALGRDGRIVAASYDHASDTCQITLDDRRDYFDRVLARYGLLTQQ
ncbi:MAG: hypothetical protein ACKVWR_21865 [Acidimicrobiales bacterium]